MEYVVVLVLGFIVAMVMIGRRNPDTLPQYGEEVYIEEDTEKQVMMEFFDLFTETITTHTGRVFIVWTETGERMCEVIDGHILPLAKKNRFIVPQQRQHRPSNDQYQQ